MFDVQVTRVPAALAGTFVFHNVYDVQVEKMLVKLMARVFRDRPKGWKVDV